LLRVVSKLVRSSRRSETDPHRFRRRHVSHHARTADASNWSGW